MIFRPELVEKILAGEKTETRRPVKDGKPCRYRAPRSYAVRPGRAEKAVGRVRVRSVRKEELGEIRAEGARREGFESVDDFLAYWRKLYGHVYLTQEVWVIRFSLPPEETPEGEAGVLEFDAERHKRRGGGTFLLQGRLYREMDLIRLTEGVSMSVALGRALKLYKFFHDTRKRGGAVEMVDARGARWELTGWDEPREGGSA